MRRRRTIAAAVTVVALIALVTSLAGCRCAAEPLQLEEQPAMWPLTGLEAPGEDAIRQRVVSVKIENSEVARPQTNLAEADVVYETLAEGGITRFNAMYHSSMPDRIGPVRSARLSDTYIVPQYNALFAYSGASQLTAERIQEAGIDALPFDEFPDPYTRSPDRPRPHDVYLDLPGFLATAEQAGFEVQVDPPELEFGEVPEALPSEPASASVVNVPFNPRNQVAWEWNAETQTYERFLNGEPHGDEGAEGGYTASNVVVLFAETQDTGRTDAAGSRVLDIVLTGSGSGLVFRGGAQYQVTWTAQNHPPRFTLSDGTAMPLQPGSTWFEVVEPGFSVSVE